jgi:hypothetical protein
VVQGRVTGDNARHPFLLPLPCQRMRPEPSLGDLVATARRRSCFAAQVFNQGRALVLFRWHAGRRPCWSACGVDDAAAATESYRPAPVRPPKSCELAAAPRAVHRVPPDAVVDDAFRADTAEQVTGWRHEGNYRPGRAAGAAAPRQITSFLWASHKSHRDLTK